MRIDGKPKRPVLRYHGGKWMLGRWIVDRFPEHRVYVEPFSGAASVLMQKPRAPVEVLNDLHARLMSVFAVLRDSAKAAELARLLRMTPYSKAEYLNCRVRAEDPIEDARRMIVLSFQGHGSTGASGGQLTGWRRSDRGARSTSASDWVGLPEHVSVWCERLQGVYLEQDTALEVIRRYDGPDTLIYVDPPYLPGTRHNGPKAYACELSEADHVALAQVLRSVASKVIVSGYPSDLYDRELYPDWTRVQHEAKTDKAKRATEVLWMSPNVQEGQLSLFGSRTRLANAQRKTHRAHAGVEVT